MTIIRDPAIFIEADKIRAVCKAPLDIAINKMPDGCAFNRLAYGAAYRAFACRYCRTGSRLIAGSARPGFLLCLHGRPPAFFATLRLVTIAACFASQL